MIICLGSLERQVVAVMQVPGQIGLFEFLEENYKSMSENEVRVEGVININTLSDFTVKSTYRDIFLIVNMLDDYVSVLSQVDSQRNGYTDYIISQFERISGELAQQIKLDKEKMYKKCRKKNSRKDDVGEDAFVMASKQRNTEKGGKDEGNIIAGKAD